MKEGYKSNETLYSREEFWQILSLYQEIFNLLLRSLPKFRDDLNIKNWYSIVDIKRWLDNWAKQIFWDYLWATHWIMEDQFKNDFDKNSTFRYIKITFLSGESITLINNPKTRINPWTNKIEIVDLPSWVLCLDNYRKKLTPQKLAEFDKLFNKLNVLERNHFKSEWYARKIWSLCTPSGEWVIDSTNKNLFSALNLEFK